MKTYNKLVRDKIDQIINTNGKGEKAVVKILNEEEFKTELLKKLEEEKNELIEAVKNNDKTAITEESADLLEVIKAINENSLEAVFEAKNKKQKERGGFKQRKFLIGVESKKEG